jgi:hypothetical protein
VTKLQRPLQLKQSYPAEPFFAALRQALDYGLINPLISYNAENIREGSMLEH